MAKRACLISDSRYCHNARRDVANWQGSKPILPAKVQSSSVLGRFLGLLLVLNALVVVVAAETKTKNNNRCNMRMWRRGKSQLLVKHSLRSLLLFFYEPDGYLFAIAKSRWCVFSLWQLRPLVLLLVTKGTRATVRIWLRRRDWIWDVTTGIITEYGGVRGSTMSLPIDAPFFRNLRVRTASRFPFSSMRLTFSSFPYLHFAFFLFN